MAELNSRDSLDDKRGSTMGQHVVRGQRTQADQQTDAEKKATSDQHKAAIDRYIADVNQHVAAAQQRAIEEEHKSGEDSYKNQLITPEANEAYLRQHQRHLKNTYPSMDLSEVSYHTERTDFPGSRHSSINTEPLTLDAEQIHDAKVQAVDVMQKADTDEAFDIFTKDLEVKGDEPPSPEAGQQVFAEQVYSLVEKADTLVEKANEVVDANQRKSTKPRIISAPDTKAQDSPAAPVEDTVKLKDD